MQLDPKGKKFLNVETPSEKLEVSSGVLYLGPSPDYRAEDLLRKISESMKRLEYFRLNAPPDVFDLLVNAQERILHQQIEELRNT